MNARERLLAVGVLVVIVVAAGGFLFQTLFLAPLADKKVAASALLKTIEEKQDRIRQVRADLPKLERWRQLSLPPDPILARREYEEYLNHLLRNSGFAGGSYTVTPRPIDAKSSPTIPQKGPVFTKLVFTVQAHAPLANIVSMLEQFYRTALLHQLKKLQITRPGTAGPQQQQRDDLDVDMTVEALIVAGAPSRPNLLPNIDPRLLTIDPATVLRLGPAGVALGPPPQMLALAAWAAGPTGPGGPNLLAQPSRQYAAIAGKNIFLGPPPPQEDRRRGDEVDVTRFVRLTSISQDDRRKEAFLYDVYNNSWSRLREDAGFNTFRVRDSDGEDLLRGRVIRIDDRDIIFRVDENYYSIHSGQSLEEGMQKSLTADQLKALGLAAANPKAGSE